MALSRSFPPLATILLCSLLLGTSAACTRKSGDPLVEQRLAAVEAKAEAADRRSREAITIAGDNGHAPMQPAAAPPPLPEMERPYGEPMMETNPQGQDQDLSPAGPNNPS